MAVRLDGRSNTDLREISMEIGVSMNAHGSCLVKFGNTHVLCTAYIDEQVPHFLKGKGKGWVTAEYGMLPASTSTRIKREASQGRQGGRTMEIQRLIGRSLRSVTNMHVMGERQVIIDCDVLQADGGTRTASITGGYVALHMAFQHMLDRGMVRDNPLISEVAGISCGIFNGEAIADLDYYEDSNADVDANFVMTGDGRIVELQSTAEKSAFTERQLFDMLSLARMSIGELIKIQRRALYGKEIYANKVTNSQ